MERGKQSIEVLKFYLRDKDSVKKEALEVIEELERRIENAKSWLEAPYNQCNPSVLDILTIPEKDE